MSQPTIVIVSDDPEFSGSISARWQAERNVPAFTLVSSDLCDGLDTDAFDVAIVGAVRPQLAAKVLRALERCGKPVLLVSQETENVRGLASQPRVLVVRRHDDWLDTLVLIASEVLRRCDAQIRLRRAEQNNAILERQAALGRYLLEMRHNLNNALTSVLGNSELLLLESKSLTPQSISQVETIRNMALRVNEIFRRFSSLEKELNVAIRQTDEGEAKSKTASTGW